jgi:hypothetical protein
MAGGISFDRALEGVEDTTHRPKQKMDLFESDPIRN